MRIGRLQIGVAAAALLAGAVAAPPNQGGDGLRTAADQGEDGLRTAATGFFRFGRIGGVDRAIDPEGRPVRLAGVDFVNPDVFYSTFLGYAPYARFVATNYPSREAWARQTASRLRAWGFNMLASHCATDLFPGFPHADTLNLNNPFAKSKDPEWRISENTDAPSTGFPNVFHPDYEKEVFAAAAKRCAPLKDDPSLVGWFIDNELCWWGRSSDPGAGLFDLVAKLPPEHSARKALEDYLAQSRRAAGTRSNDGSAPLRLCVEKIPRDVKTGFLRLVAARYFAVNAAAIRAADPNHAVLGCRFARGTLWTHDVVWEEAGKHCDAVSLNFYPWCDLDRGTVLTDQGGIPVQGEFRRVHALCGRPLLVTEWSFPALDAGRPCLHGAGQRFHTQAERASAVELYVRTLRAEPYVAGYNWFMWVDQPAAGLRPALPEDSNYGLVDERDEPYALVTEAFARANRDAAPPRQTGDGGPETASPLAGAGEEAGLSERERFFAETLALQGGAAVSRGGASGVLQGGASGVSQGGASAPPLPVSFARAPDGSWALSNGLVRLSGRVGGAFMAEEAAFRSAADAEASAFLAAGRFRTLLQLFDGRRRQWIDADRVTDVAFELDEATGIGTVTIRAEAGFADTSLSSPPPAPRSAPGGSGGPAPRPSKAPARFAMSARLSLAPGRAEVLAEIASAENLSGEPLPVERVFLRPFAAEAKPGQIPSVPKLWKGPHDGWWSLSGGRRFGAVTRDASSCSFRFYLSGDGAQHPDAPFVEDGPFEIPPGATWRPSSPMGAILKCE